MSGTIAPRPDPELVVFFVGHVENESEMKYARDLRATLPWPKCRSVLVTGAKDHRSGWNDTDEILHVEQPWGRGTMAYAHESRWFVARAIAEGLVDEADILLSTSWYRALQLWIMGTDEITGYLGPRLRPLVYVSPQVNDTWEVEFNASWPWKGHVEADDLWWRVMANWPNLHSIHLGTWDREHAYRKLRRVDANPPLERAHVFWWWAFEEFMDPARREPKVVWCHRLSRLKDPQLAGQIGRMLLGLGRSFESYAAFGSPKRKLAAPPNLTVGLPREQFWERAGGAMVQLITSHREAGILVLWELAERGVVPVVRRKPWAEQALPGWPLLFDNAGEAVVMCEMVLDDYEKWRGALERLLRAHYSPDGERAPNGGKVWEAIWRDWCAWTPSLDVTTRQRTRGALDRARGVD